MQSNSNNQTVASTKVLSSVESKGAENLQATDIQDNAIESITQPEVSQQSEVHDLQNTLITMIDQANQNKIIQENVLKTKQELENMIKTLEKGTEDFEKRERDLQQREIDFANNSEKFSQLIDAANVKINNAEQKLLNYDKLKKECDKVKQDKKILEDGMGVYLKEINILHKELKENKGKIQQQDKAIQDNIGIIQNNMKYFSDIVNSVPLGFTQKERLIARIDSITQISDPQDINKILRETASFVKSVFKNVPDVKSIKKQESVNAQSIEQLTSDLQKEKDKTTLLTKELEQLKINLNRKERVEKQKDSQIKQLIEENQQKYVMIEEMLTESTKLKSEQQIVFNRDAKQHTKVTTLTKATQTDVNPSDNLTKTDEKTQAALRLQYQMIRNQNDNIMKQNEKVEDKINALTNEVTMLVKNKSETDSLSTMQNSNVYGMIPSNAKIVADVNGIQQYLVQQDPILPLNGQPSDSQFILSTVTPINVQQEETVSYIDPNHIQNMPFTQSWQPQAMPMQSMGMFPQGQPVLYNQPINYTHGLNVLQPLQNMMPTESMGMVQQNNLFETNYASQGYVQQHDITQSAMMYTMPPVIQENAIHMNTNRPHNLQSQNSLQQNNVVDVTNRSTNTNIGIATQYQIAQRPKEDESKGARPKVYNVSGAHTSSHKKKKRVQRGFAGTQL